VTPVLLSPVQIDALREVANIGSGYAATALSQLSGMSIMIDVPSIHVASVTDVARRIAGPDSRVVTLSMQILGDLAGHTVFVLPERNACLLCDVLLQRQPGTSGLHGDMEQSSLKETGNIMAGSFLNALALVLGNMLLPSVPTVLIERSDVIAATTGGQAEEVLVVETSFKFEEADTGLDQLTGVFLFVLDDEESINQLFLAISAWPG
jgi:chemotaxis protein CheC